MIRARSGHEMNGDEDFVPRPDDHQAIQSNNRRHQEMAAQRPREVPSPAPIQRVTDMMEEKLVEVMEDLDRMKQWAIETTGYNYAPPPHLSGDTMPGHTLARIQYRISVLGDEIEQLALHLRAV